MSLPCTGKSALFDSTDMFDHREAKALCQTCPAITACMKNLMDAKRAAGALDGPEGTWAGQLLTGSRRSDATWSDCGSPGAYRRHYRRNDPLCSVCRNANTEYRRRRKEAS